MKGKLMSRLAIVFPGQGSQKVGMGKDIYQEFAEVRDIFQEASDILQKDMALICFEGPEEIMKQTENTQPGIFLVSISLWEILKKRGLKPELVAGHSLGEIAAYYAAEVIDLKTALELIKVRGQAMANSYPSQDSAMAAVMGLSEGQISQVLSSMEELAVMANYNSPEQIVISGTKKGVELASQRLQEIGAKRVLVLNVSGAFHSPLMQKASDELAKFLQNKQFYDAKIPVVLNRTAQAETKQSILKENLSLQVSSPVQWVKSVQYMQNSIDTMIECGPGKVLSGLVKRINKEIITVNVESLDSLKELIEQKIMVG